MKKKLTAAMLCLMMLLSMIVPAAAADPKKAAADRLYTLGLFRGVGTNPDGTPVYALERKLSRQEAVTMLVRLLGKEKEATENVLPHPFSDVDSWADPYVGYAYQHGLTNGIDKTLFGGRQSVTAAQYLTFVLRALGYVSDVDFAWDRAWEKTDALGITAGEYSAVNNQAFIRGDAAFVSEKVLSADKKDGSSTLFEQLIADGAVKKEADEKNDPLDALYDQFTQEILAAGKRPVTVSLDAKDMMGREALQPYFKEYDGFAGSGETVEEAMRQAFTHYLTECIDGDYSDGYIGTPSFRCWNHAVDAFFLTDTKGTIVAYGIRTDKSSPEFTLYFCKVDSRDFMDARVAEVMEIIDAVKEIPCEARREGGKYVFSFSEIPKDAVWFDFDLYGCITSTGKRDYKEDRTLFSTWSSMREGFLPTDPVQESYSCDAFYTEYIGTAYRFFIFMDADYNMIAYSIGKIENR